MMKPGTSIRWAKRLFVGASEESALMRSIKAMILKIIVGRQCCVTRAASLDHLISAGKKRRRHFEAERLGSHKVDDQFRLGRQLDGKIGGLVSVENTGSVDAN